MRAGALAGERGEIDAFLGRDAARERAGLDAIIALAEHIGGGELARRGGGLRLGGFRCRGGFGLCLCRAIGGRRGIDTADILAVFGQHGDDGVDLHALGAFLDQDFRERALIDGLDFHRGLVGLDLGDDIAALNRVARLFQPFRQRAFLHGRRQSGHGDVNGHVSVLRCLREGPVRTGSGLEYPEFPSRLLRMASRLRQLQKMKSYYRQYCPSD